MDALSPLNRLRQNLRPHAIINGFDPVVDAHIKHVWDEWAYPTTPQDLEELERRCRNIRLPEPNTSVFGGPFLPDRLLEDERILPVNPVTAAQTFAQLPALFSPRYPASFVFVETVQALGHKVVRTNVHPSINPKGGDPFKPVGICTLFISLSGDATRTFFVTALVLDQPAVETGVALILGRPDLERAFGRANPF